MTTMFTGIHTRTLGWAVVLMGLTMLTYYLLTNRNPVLISVLLVNLLLIGWKYHADLRQPPGLRGWVRRRLPLSPPAR